MSNNICAKFNRSAKRRCCQRVVDNERNLHLSCRFREFLKIQNAECRISKCLSKQNFRIRSLKLNYFFCGNILIEKFNIECVPYCELTDSGDIVPIDSEKSDNSE